MISTSDSLKRIAWAYGCSKKDSPEERAMRDLLFRKMEEMRVEPDPTRDFRTGAVIVEMS